MGQPSQTGGESERAGGVGTRHCTGYSASGVTYPGAPGLSLGRRLSGL